MAGFTTDAWLQTYIEKAQSLSQEERTSWIESLPPDVAEALRAWLLEQESPKTAAYLPLLDLASSPRLAKRQVGAYTLISPLGVGGMGAVWLAERTDGRFERKVAIKFILLALSGAEAASRFRQEGMILGRLSHPNIAQLIDAGVTVEGEPYLVLEYVQGAPIDTFFDQAGLNIEQRIRLFLDVLSAVAHAHQNLVVHRDLKPANVLVHDGCEIRLLDFGIAKLLEVNKESDLTQTGIVFTPAYAAPEQLLGEPVTTATDVYSLGVLLFLLLSGQHPYGKEPLGMNVVEGAIYRECPRMSDRVAADADPAAVSVAGRRGATPEKLKRTLRGDLDTIVAKALRKEPHLRYASVTAFANDLRCYLNHEPIQARPTSFTYKAAKFVRRNRIGVTLAFLTILAVAGAIVAIATQMYSARQQRDFALHELSRAEQVMDINELLLSEVEPQGKALKPGDFIERELKIVEQEHYDNLANHVELLLSIGRQYSTQDLNEQGIRVLREGYDLSRRVTDPGLRGEASCDLARGLINIGKLDEAESLYQQGMRELPGDSLFAQSRVDCLQAGGEIAHHRGESGEEIRLTESALRELYASPIHSAPTKLEVLTDLATMYGDNGRFRESFQTFQEASALMTSLGWEGTRNALKLYNDWAMMLVYAGRPLEAAQRFEQALAMREGGTPNPALLHNYAASLRFLGRWNDALHNAQQALAVATQQQHTLVVMQSKLDIGSIYREQKRFAESTAIFAELETMMRQNLPPGHFAFSLLTSEESLLAQAQGDMSKALVLADQAITIDEAAIGAGKQGTIFLPTLLTRRSGIELAAGRAEQSRTDAERAVSLLQSSLEPGAPSAKTGLAYLSLGRALAAQGKTQDAHAKFLLAEQHLTNSLGAEAPDSRIAVDLAGGA